MAHRRAKVDAGDGAARAGADAARLERDRKGRPAEALLQPRRDQPDHARMPAVSGRHDHRALLLDAERRHRLGFRFGERLLLDHLAFAVEPVELGCDRAGLRRVVLQQQPHAEIGAPDAPAGIDARPEQEAEMPAFRRAGEARRIHQRGQADMLAPPHRDQALGHEGAVEPFQRHHVRDGAERHQIEQVEQIGLRPQHMPEAALAQFAIDRDHGHEHEAAGRQIVQAREVVEPVRIDQRIGRRQRLIGLMMVDHDHVEAELLGFERAARCWWCRNRR